MKAFVKKYIWVFAVTLSMIFLAIFLMFIFRRVGDDVYIVGMSGNVNIADSADITKVKPASVGMKLKTGDIVVTDDMSSCILSYNKKSSEKSNFLNIGENSQVMLYEKNAQGGYKFFMNRGSAICNMPIDETYRTTISTKLFNLFADGAILKVSYDDEATAGKVYVFDGNPNIQTIQPSGTINMAEKLLKNSVCAVNEIDGAIGYGCLNIGFGLNSLTAQDLKIMSGIANVWSERISFGANELEQAFQTASDYAKWTMTTPVTVSVTETSIPVSSDTMETTVPVTPETTVLPETSTAVTSVTDDISYVNISLPVTAFSRSTVVDLSDTDVSIITTVTEKETKYTTAPITTTSETHTVTSGIKNSGNLFTVIFAYNENGKDYWSIQLVKYGESAIAPEVPAIPGKKFVKWDKDFSRVISNMSVTAIFEDSSLSDSSDSSDDTFTVNFYVDSTLWKTMTVKRGETAFVENPVSAGKKFRGWSESLIDVQSDMTVFAVFEK